MPTPSTFRAFSAREGSVLGQGAGNGQGKSWTRPDSKLPWGLQPHHPQLQACLSPPPPHMPPPGAPGRAAESSGFGVGLVSPSPQAVTLCPEQVTALSGVSLLLKWGPPPWALMMVECEKWPALGLACRIYSVIVLCPLSWVGPAAESNRGHWPGKPSSPCYPLPKLSLQPRLL